MRRTILLVVLLVVALVLVAPAATAIPEPKGCPAEASVWTLVEFGQTPYDANSLFTWYFREHPEAAADFADRFGFELPEEEEQAYALAEGIVAPVDRNGDQKLCIWWSAGIAPGLPDYTVSFVDNNSNAQH